jgi:hypothetical protein
MCVFFPLVALLMAGQPSASPAADPTNGGAGPRVVTTAAAERIPLAIGRVGVDVYALEKRIVLHPVKNAAQVAARIRGVSRICPTARALRDQVELTCITRQLDSRLLSERGQVALEIYQLRGVPWRLPREQLLMFYDPFALHMGSGCPGTTPIARGECALRDRRFDVAAVEFRRAFVGEGRRMAALRLGDLALLADDPVNALGWYSAAGRYGLFGRMAMIHLCEMSGTCLPDQYKHIFEPGGLPEPLHTEALLRGARLAAYLGNWQDSMARLRGAILDGDRACEGDNRSFCRQLVMSAFRDADEEGVLAAIDTYLILPARSEGVLAEELARAGAERAVAMGAPVFGGTMLAAAFAAGAIAVTSQGDYLLRTAEMYLLGKDTVRARLVCVFAESRLGRAAMTGPRWRAVLDQILYSRQESGPPANHDAAIAEATRDLAQAYRTLARAVRARLEAAAAARAKAAEEP